MKLLRALLCGTAAVAISYGGSTVAAAAEPAPSDYTLNLFPAEHDARTVVLMGGPATPYYGKINPFYGNLNPFWGKIQPFWGNINPFWGNINPFAGDVSSFWGNLNPFYGNINPFWGKIQPFWGNISPLWGTINPFWGSLQPFSNTTAAQYTLLQGQLNSFYSQTKAVWGVNPKFDSVSKEIFKKYGIDLTKPATLSGLSAEQRARFFMDWYDGMMSLSGRDQVDHWMGTVNWRPSLVQDNGGGKDTIVGLIDAKIKLNVGVVNEVEFVGGYSVGYSSDHGAAVAGLIAANHDNQGVMGVAPDAKLMLYNPFDSTGTASWADVRSGVVALAAKNVNVVNLSLGVPGWTADQGLVDIVSDPTLKEQIKNIVFVAAAGNDGSTQTANVAWKSTLSRDNLILVGSVAVDETISSFSNKPGEACFTLAGNCAEADKLKYHFLVAPGEMILVSDNKGGVMRVSGTSFAAPLVSGTFALMYDRWPWLKQQPSAAAQMVLQSAKDLGAPGVDGVYGWGLLDIEAALSPLDFNNLVVYQGASQVPLQSLKSMALSATTRGTWQATGASIYAIENFRGTYRDFEIPLSSLLYGQSVSRAGRTERFQRHLYSRLLDWSQGRASFASFGRVDEPGLVTGDWTLGFSGGELDPYSDAYDPELPFEMGYSIQNKKAGFGLQFGRGEGATDVFEQPGFGFHSDYDPASGGVNPILGFASGDEYVGVSIDLDSNTTMTVGFTQFEDSEAANPLTGGTLQSLPGMDAYAASALIVDVKHFAADWLTLNLNYTQLQEETGLLGVQGMGALSLSGGATTDALTVGAAVRLDDDLTFSLSATAAKTRAGAFDSELAVSGGGITSTAFAAALQQTDVFKKNDALRFSLLQPLHIEDGSLDYTSTQVVDRETGEIGLATDQWEISNGDRQIAAEVLYAMPMLDGAAELSFTARVNLTGSSETDDGITVGSRFAVRF